MAAAVAVIVVCSAAVAFYGPSATPTAAKWGHSDFHTVPTGSVPHLDSIRAELEAYSVTVTEKATLPFDPSTPCLSGRKVFKYCSAYTLHTRYPTRNAIECMVQMEEDGGNAMSVGADCVVYTGCTLQTMGDRQKAWGYIFFTEGTESCNQPVDCEGDFGEFGACSADCGGGTKTRTFQITQPHTNGGSSCSSSDGETESAGCNPQSCAVIQHGLRHETWENMNGKATLWHDETGALKHTQPGALAMDSAGSFRIQALAPDSSASGACHVEGFEAPLDQVSDGAQRLSGYFTPPESADYMFRCATSA